MAEVEVLASPVAFAEVLEGDCDSAEGAEHEEKGSCVLLVFGDTGDWAHDVLSAVESLTASGVLLTPMLRSEQAGISILS